MTLFLTLMTWAINLIYLFSLLPQILKTYRRGTIQGMSPLTMLCSWNGYAFYATYTYGQNLPLAYKICVPLWLVSATLWIAQKSYYTKGWWWTTFYTGNLLAHLTLFAATLKNPALSLWAGWGAALLWGVYVLPQIHHNAQRQSVKGLSKAFVSLMMSAALLEIAYGLLVGLPLPTVCNAMREVVILGILLCQFSWYRHTKKKKRKLRPQQTDDSGIFASLWHSITA